MIRPSSRVALRAAAVASLLAVAPGAAQAEPARPEPEGFAEHAQLTHDDLDAIADGGPLAGDHLLYVGARVQLDELDAGRGQMTGEPVAAATGPTAEQDQVAAAVTPARRSTATMPLWWLAVAIGVAAVGAVALVASLRRGGLRRVTVSGEQADRFELLSEAATTLRRIDR